jgi:cell division transport system permease protein
MSEALSIGSAPIRRNAPRFGASDRLVPHSRLTGPMPWVIAIMIALTVIAAGAGLALRNLSDRAGAEIAGGLTVQILEGAPAARERQAQAAVAQLRTREDVAEVRRVPEEELNALLEPWLGKQALTGEEAIPVPALIDARLRGPVTERRLEELRVALVAAVPSARIDAQAGWLGPVFDALASLQWLALGLVVLLAGTSAAAVWLAARSALGANRETIEVIHLLGATDGQIARLFERSIGLDAAIGGLAGLALGGGALWLLGGQFARLGSGMVAGGTLGPVDWVLLAAIPAAGVLLAMVTARLTVLGALRRML